jgi:hypothetical protein
MRATSGATAATATAAAAASHPLTAADARATAYTPAGRIHAAASRYARKEPGRRRLRSHGVAVGVTTVTARLAAMASTRRVVCAVALLGVARPRADYRGRDSRPTEPSNKVVKPP